MILAGLINICGSNIRQTRILVVKTVHSAYLATSHQHNNKYWYIESPAPQWSGDVRMRPHCVRCAGVLDQAVRSPHFNRGRTFLHQQSQVLPHPPSGLRRVEPQVTLNKIYWLISCSCFRITNPGLADTGTYECQINTEPKRSRLYHLDVVISKVRRNIHHMYLIKLFILFIKYYLLLVGGILLESSYKICRHCHSNINSATPHKRSQIPALASASVQCPVSSSGSGAKLDQSDISRDRTNFPFPLLATLLLQTRTRDTQPAPHQQSNMFGNQTGFNNF